MLSLIFNLFYSLIGFFTAFFFLLLGVIAISLFWSEKLQIVLINAITHDTIAISLFGIGFLVIGFMMIAHLFSGLKKHYYYIKTAALSFSADEQLIKQYIDLYWQELFPQQPVYTQLILKYNKIKIIADLPYRPLSERKELLLRIQKELQENLFRVLGYTQELTLALSFQKQHL